ncbi:YraN family protein [Hazenella sp. IB182357]|uniref:UPF0102 protein IC620_03545 n=1 Tax=Polycladospora coralii TaxID=2771432 RepID=A0A926RTA1_9BACL|nr:YraN family protein [Polycladospora coralii]MBD1371428.1 YraN family protein [Polycladospora coralii]MBS7530396.1 YraN family protein [Polycladospora coralii]
MPKDRRKLVGRIGEEMATQHLQKQDFKIVARNWTCSQGELDIIAYDENELVFVEVRTTSGSRYGLGLESIGFRKQKKVRTVALHYMNSKHIFHTSIRFDMISVKVDKNLAQEEIVHIKGAF